MDTTTKQRKAFLAACAAGGADCARVAQIGFRGGLEWSDFVALLDRSNQFAMACCTDQIEVRQFCLDDSGHTEDNQSSVWFESCRGTVVYLLDGFDPWIEERAFVETNLGNRGLVPVPVTSGKRYDAMMDVMKEV